MNKKEFVAKYAENIGESKKKSEELLDAFLNIGEEALTGGDNIQFVGWGTFEVGENNIKFKAAKKLRNKINT